MNARIRARYPIPPLLVLAAAAVLSPTVQAGPLEPPGPPGDPTMLPIDQVDPRNPIYAGDLPLTITQQGSSYYLTENITTTGQGIIIQTDDVTIDLMGFSLGSTFQGSGLGIDGTLANGVTIRNGTIRGWTDTGVRLQDHAVVENVLVEGNGGSGIDVRYDARVIGCTAYFNDMHGIVVSSGSIVKDSVVASNDENGIWVSAPVSATITGALVTGNVSDANTRNGIRVDGYATVTGNHVRANDQHGLNAKAGIWVNGPYNRVEGNLLTLNNIGIQVDGDYNVVVRNVVGDSVVRNFDESSSATGNYMPVWAVGTTGAPEPWANLEQP